MTTDIDKLIADHALDGCVCGDYRRDHKDGRGPCIFNRPGDLTHGFVHCDAFRLSKRYSPTDAKVKE